ncbi:MAG: TonB-dependent receptor [Candidatus Acidiferrales bacterium]
MTNAIPFAGESIANCESARAEEARWRFVGAIVRVAVLAAMATPAWPQQNASDLADRSLEDLMNIEVTSVSKKGQKLSRTASAIFVITAEDIRRSGATNIPDLLRMVPGLNVAQINGANWAVSARGFNEEFSNKLLVLIDGRTVYSPIFSGVYWDAENVPLENIDRIEVIRGPGATVWGANAVNGVISIITKKASDTQGGLIAAGSGNYEQGFGTVRYGGKLGSDAAYRAFVNDSRQNHFQSLSGGGGGDGWDAFHAGFRLDATVSAKDSLNFEGDTYLGSEGEMVSTIASISPPVNQVFRDREYFSGWDVLSRWNHVISPRSETNLQVYFDRSSRVDPTFATAVNMFDVDFQHHIGWGNRNDFVWGLGYRLTSDDTSANLRVSFNPADRATQLFSAFVQDEIAIRPDRLLLTLGAKFEHNAFSGFGIEPSIRFAWIVNEKNMVWGAVSRALRTPARSDEDVRFNEVVVPNPGSLPILVSVFGNPNEKNENLVATEIGYRTEVASRLSLDLAAFFNHYDQIRTSERMELFPESNPPPPHLVSPLVFNNLAHGETHGVEFVLNWKVTGRWIVSPGYSFFALHMHPDANSLDPGTPSALEARNPNHQAQLRSHVDLSRRWQWNTSAYFVERIASDPVPSYTRLDTNLTWQPLERFSISLVGQNLLKDLHLESNNPNQTSLSSLIKRSAYAKLTWRF